LLPTRHNGVANQAHYVFQPITRPISNQTQHLFQPTTLLLPTRHTKNRSAPLRVEKTLTYVEVMATLLLEETRSVYEILCLVGRLSLKPTAQGTLGAQIEKSRIVYCAWLEVSELSIRNKARWNLVRRTTSNRAQYSLS
jgi:hypothetical protein